MEEEDSDEYGRRLNGMADIVFLPELQSTFRVWGPYPAAVLPLGPTLAALAVFALASSFSLLPPSHLSLVASIQCDCHLHHERILCLPGRLIQRCSDQCWRFWKNLQHVSW